MRSTAAAVLAAVALLAPAAGRAQPVSSLSGPGPDTWIELHLGASIPQHQDLDGVEPGWAIGGAFGARFSPYLGVEGELGYTRASGQEAGVTLTASDVPFKANLRLRAPWKVMELSAAAGVGLHVASLTREVPDPAGGTVSTTRTSVAFGFQVAAGLGFHLSPTMLVGAGVERTFVEPKFEGTGVRFDALRVALTLTYHL
jgi:opacity protein-like surface antigen